MPLNAATYGQVMGAIRALSIGNALDAFQKTERLLTQLTFGSSRPPSLDDLATRSLNLRTWRGVVMRTLHRAAEAGPSGQTVDRWAERIKGVFEASVREVTGAATKLGDEVPEACRWEERTPEEEAPFDDRRRVPACR
jgi:hypothetical protein